MKQHPTITHFASYEEMSKAAAKLVTHYVFKTNANLALPTGGTPIGMYKELVEKNLDWANVRTFNLDEYYPINIDSQQSYYYYMYENLFSTLKNHQSPQISFPHAYYDNHISSAGGLDLAVIGVGNNGHIAFNEPGSEPNSETRIVKLDKQTIEDNARFFDSIEDVPTHSITMGISTIFKAREILILAQGKSKLEILKKGLWNKETKDIPVSWLRKHRNLKVFYCD